VARLRADSLGANPIEAITRGLGEWTLRFLLITLAVTPLRKYTGWHWIVRLRRMLGLFAFAYGVSHLITYVWLDQFFDWPAIAKDILKRPFITVGFAALVLMIPLAATSSNAPSAGSAGAAGRPAPGDLPDRVLGCVHFWWLVKKDITEPLIYAVITAALLGIRAWWREQERRKQLAGGYLPQPPRLTGKVIRIFAK
jgi:sulfoxide reductase heme-binding subunit YedZ